MRKFMEKYASIASSVLNGFVRLVFRGYLRSIVHPDGMKRHLSYQDVSRRLFGAHVEKTTPTLKSASLAEAARLGRPVVCLRSSHTRKEAAARQILAENPVDSGPLCVLSCVCGIGAGRWSLLAMLVNLSGALSQAGTGTGGVLLC